MNLNNDKSKKIMVAIIIPIFILIFIATFVINQMGPYNKKNKDDVVVDIPTGSTSSQIADILKENNLIKNKTLFKLYLRISNKTSKLKSGKYLFNQTYSNEGIIQDLSIGKVYNDGIKITVPEGSTSFEIIDILMKNKLGNKAVYEKLINSPKEFSDKFKFLDDEKIISLEGFYIQVLIILMRTKQRKTYYLTCLKLLSLNILKNYKKDKKNLINLYMKL